MLLLASAFSIELKQEIALPIVFGVCLCFHKEGLLLDGRWQALICSRRMYISERILHKFNRQVRKLVRLLA